MASGPITSWQIDGGKKWKHRLTLFSWAPKSLCAVAAAIKLKDDCSLEKKKAVANLDSILESRDITLLTKVCRVKAMCSHVWMYGCTCTVVMYGCESWTIKKVKLRRIHVLELWCKRRLLRGPWTKEIKPVNPKGNHP